MVTCTAAFIYDLKRQRSLQHFLTIEDLPEQFHTVVIPSGEASSTHTNLFDLLPVESFFWRGFVGPRKKFSEQQYLMRYLQPDKNVSMELCGNSANVNL